MSATISIEDWPTQSARLPPVHAGRVADEPRAREQALRRMPLLYSLTLKLRDAAVAPQWLASISMSRSLARCYRVAEAKGSAAQRSVGISGDVPPSDLVTGVRPEREA